MKKPLYIIIFLLAFLPFASANYFIDSYNWNDEFDGSDFNSTFWTDYGGSSAGAGTSASHTEEVTGGYAHLRGQVILTGTGNSGAGWAIMKSQTNYNTGEDYRFYFTVNGTKTNDFLTLEISNNTAYTADQTPVNSQVVYNFGNTEIDGGPFNMSLIMRRDGNTSLYYDNGTFISSIELDAIGDIWRPQFTARIGENSGTGTRYTDWQIFNFTSSSWGVIKNTPANNTFVANPMQPFNITVDLSPIATVENTTIQVYYENGTLFNETFTDVANAQKVFQETDINIDSIGSYYWTAKASDTNGVEYLSSNFSFTYGVQENSFTYNTTSIETSTESFVANITLAPGTALASSTLYYNGTAYTPSITTSGPDTILSTTLDVPFGNDPKTVYYNITYTTGETFKLSEVTQSSNILNMSLCGNPHTVPFANYTFKNETVSQESVDGFFSSSTFTYFIGTGSVNKTFTYSDASEVPSIAFCYIPTAATVKNIIEINYDNADSQQRSYEPGQISLSSSVTDTVLWLLPTSEGIFVTFQVINVAEQPLSGVTLTLERAGLGVISTTTTGASGTSTVFINPNFEYTLTASKSGFSDFSATQIFSLTEYTITLAGDSTAAADYTKGISKVIQPQIGTTLVNNTNRNFNVTLASSFWTIDSWGFVLYNSSGANVGSVSSAAPGFLGTDYYTGNDTSVSMNLFWVIEGTYTNETYTWSIDEGDRKGTIAGFFNRLQTYAGEGLFGLNSFNLAIIGFLFIFLVVGVMNVKFGLSGTTAQGVLTILALGLTALFYAIGILNSVVTVEIVAFYVIGMIFWEVRKG